MNDFKLIELFFKTREQRRMTSGSQDELAGQSIAGGRYEVKYRLGAGGMGTVWFAIQKPIGTEVVLKFPHRLMLMDPTFGTRFRLEMDSLSKLSNKHAAIVNILDVGEVDGLPFVAMQYLSGGSLDDKRRVFQQMLHTTAEPYRVFRWLLDIAEALDFIHAWKYVHRDIKPANILFDSGGRAYVADFGIAKCTSESLTKSAQLTRQSGIVGTLEFMAYELLMGDSVDGRTDQYALAVTVYEVLSGQRPYRSDHPLKLAEKLKGGAASRIDALCPGLPSTSADAVHKALSFLPADRFQTCSDFIETFLNGLKEMPKSGSGMQGHLKYADLYAATTPIATPVAEPVAAPVAEIILPAVLNALEILEEENVPTESDTDPTSGRWKPTSTTPTAVDIDKADKVHASVPKPQTDEITSSIAWSRRGRVCPWCWHHFFPKDILWVSEHPDLGGDQKITDEPKRFLPDLFTADCHAIDPLGSVCHKVACPNCHLILPRSVLELDPLFISMIGVPGSGKSCLTAAMTWKLRRTLPQNFHLAFTDADSELNGQLCENEQALFIREANTLVKLAKTMLEGEGYRYTVVEGKPVSLTQPMIFALKPRKSHPNFLAMDRVASALCMYDQPGEQFLPGRASYASRHLAAADGLIFVFDPSQHPKFRARLKHKIDPQFEQDYYSGKTLRQELALVEAVNCIRSFSTDGDNRKCDKPLVFVVNKYDAWAKQFRGERLRDPWGKKPNTAASEPDLLDVTEIRSYSKKIKQILNLVCPEVVLTAEDLFSNVTYVPVSAFGRPVEVDKLTGVGGVSTDRINPMWTEVPLLFLLSQIRRGLIRKV